MNDDSNVFLAEFTLEVIHNLKPDSLITEKIRVMESLDDDVGKLRLGTLNQCNTSEEARQMGEKTMNDFLDLYCALLGQAVEILPESLSSTTQLKGGSEISIPVSLKLPTIFLYDKKLSENMTKDIEALQDKKFLYLRNAMYYYRKAKLEELTNTKLILFFICLEALFSNNSQEIRYRFANRLATLIGRNNEERVTISDDGNNIYNTRSNIVHGRETTVNEESIAKIDEWITKSFRYFFALIEHYPQHEDLLKFLDRTLLDSNAFEQLKKYTNSIDQSFTELEELIESEKNKTKESKND